MLQGKASQVDDQSNPLSTADNKTNNLHWDLWVLLFFIVICSAAAIHFDIFEELVELTEKYEKYQLDEVFTVLICCSVFFLVFSIRRVHELRSEMQHRLHIEKGLFQQAMFDELTGLPNRRYFTALLNQRIEWSHDNKQQLALVLLDISDFKLINDIQGHATGDKLLQAVAKFLKQSSPNQEYLARLSGNEFAIIINAEQLKVELSAQKMLDSLTQGFLLKGELKRLQAAIGISCMSSESDTAEELLRTANIALHEAKRQGKHRYAQFVPIMDLKLRKRKQLEIALRQAINNNLLELHYQPIFSCAEQKLLGYEALCRWNDPTLGSVSPDIFIDIAEETGLIEPLGRWVMREAIREATAWPAELFVSVNVSPKQFYRKSFVDSISNALREHQLAAHRLEIEITENCLVLEPESASKALFELKEMGVSSALDDFGTGYSSLSYLRNFKFDKLKIDRSFIEFLHLSDDDQMLVRAIIEMSSSLGMTTTAEGIEAAEQLQILQQLGAHQVQGFLLGKPKNAMTTKQHCMSELLSAHSAADGD
ncbi:putative bifunctional diguanylate cyclase/phosphodiesterase [Alginatibacterium sediminis]|nr:bifunctional diguanylate cyclase/phosphodiesterase [Alginatibacterium sediminis]